MANFDTAYKKLIGNEGGYANNPLDKGGETYRGIARKYHPEWEGWSLIDDFKKQNPGFTAKDINNKFNKDTKLQAAIKKFYKVHYWDNFYLDGFSMQAFAEQIFDDCVNRGVNGAKNALIRILRVSANTSIKKAIELLEDLCKK